jgi:hypothetical protein
LKDHARRHQILVNLSTMGCDWLLVIPPDTLDPPRTLPDPLEARIPILFTTTQWYLDLICVWLCHLKIATEETR